jgi:aldehyde:ferredoxin oxidoreductase
MEQRKTAYTEMDWDEHGVPTTEELKRLGLENVDRALENLRK